MDTAAESDGSVVCLIGADEELYHVSLQYAGRLAEAIEAPLAPLSMPRRGAIDSLPEIEHSTLIVAPAVRRGLFGPLDRNRCPMLAKRVQIPTVFVPEAAADLARDISEGEIVCGVDGSRSARSAAQTASALAGRLRLPMSLFHARQPVPPLAMATAGGGAAIQPVDPADESLESSWDLLVALDRATPKPARLRLRSGPAAACLNDYASHRGAPLIIVGAPDRGPLPALPVPSTAWDLDRTASAPVMYVPEGFAPSW